MNAVNWRQNWNPHDLCFAQRIFKPNMFECDHHETPVVRNGCVARSSFGGRAIQSFSLYASGYIHDCRNGKTIWLIRRAYLQMNTDIPRVLFFTCSDCRLAYRARQQLRALVLSGQDWRTGGVALDLVARNERILAHVA